MTILSTIMGVESSGGHNVLQGNIGDINNRTGNLAQGYFQITTPTWAQFGGNASGFSNALSAPYSTQLDTAMNIPVSRWGPNTINSLAANGYQAQPGETLGQMLTRYGEDPSATVAADGSTYNGAPDTSLHGPDGALAGTGGIGSDTGAVANATPSSPLGNDQGTPNLGGGASQTGTNGPFYSANGTPIYVTDISGAGEKAGNAVQAGLVKTASAVTTSEQKASTTGTGWLNSIFSAETDALVRGGFLVAGVLAILGAGLFFYLESAKAPSVIPVPV